MVLDIKGGKRLDAASQQVTLARTELSARHIELQSGGNTVLGAVDAKADTLDIQASGKLIFQAQHSTDSASYQEAKGDAAWVSASGKGHVDETTEYSRFNVGKLTVDAKGGVEVQIGGKDTPASLARQPGMGWVDQLVNDPALAGKVDWQRVQEAHDKWQYRQTGLGPVAAAVVTLGVGVATAGAGAAAAGTAGTATTAGTGMAGALGLSASATSTLGVVLQAGISTLASQATVSLVNNGGDLGAVFKEMGSSESLKAIATSMVTAGVIQGLSTSGLLPANLANATNGSAKFIDQLQRQLIDQTASGVVRSAVYGTDLGEELKQGILNAFLNTTAAQGAFAIGSNGPVSAGGNGNLDALATELAHGFLGCLSGAARAGSGDGCAPGALGAVAGHLASGTMPGLSPEQVLAVSQLVGGLAAGLAGQGDNGIYLGARTAANAVANNRMLHASEQETAKQLFEKAQKEGLPYTLEDIEGQMRLMGNTLFGVESNHAEAYVNTSADAQAFQALQNGLLQDPSMPKGTSGNTVYEILGTPNAAIQSFVVKNTKDGAGYIPGISPYVPSNTGQGPVLGSPPSLGTVACANGDARCVSGVGMQQNAPLTEQQRQSAADYVGQAATNYQRIAILASTAGKPEIGLAYEIAASAANIIEQSLRPSVGKVSTDAALDLAVNEAARRTGLPKSVLFEMSEQHVKPLLQPLIVYVDKTIHGK